MEHVDGMSYHAQGIVTMSGIMRGLTTARLAFREVDCDSKVSKQSHRVRTGLSVELVGKTGREERDTSR
jgi:hypothetical protein